ncbi:MAG: TIGR03016 family PEP-CTERM system-associated outer membrane protein [Gammaproteobacteria bacterium]|nr:TIGR03016 family PEP-CTERM system-associated outer membrane protein [Gammaproteobacteria bacterium]
MNSIHLQAKNYRLRPGVSVQELYSDNINLAPDGEKEAAFVTEVSPFLTFNGQGARNRINSAFRLENLFFHGISRDRNTFFQGQLESTTRLWANSFFLDLRGSHSQANTSNRGRVAVDNISQGGGRAEVTTYTVSPYWNINFGGYARGEARFTYAEVKINNDDNTNTDISDSRIIEEKISLRSGNKFDAWGWELGIVNRKENRLDSENADVHYFNTFGELNLRVLPRFVIFTRVGYADNDLGFNQLSSNNGVYYQGGARWRPTNSFTLSAAGGNNSFIQLSASPFDRSSLNFGFRHNTVGLNTGSQWNANFLYTANQLLWRLGYRVDTVSTQQVLLERDIFATGLRDSSSSSGLTVNNDIGQITSLQNEVFERERGEASIQGIAGKNTVNLTGYAEKRKFEGDRDNEMASGAFFSWAWRFDNITSSAVTADFEKIEGGNLDTNTRWGIGAQIRRSIMQYFSATLGYRFTRQNANVSESEFSENRIFARINFIYR